VEILKIGFGGLLRFSGRDPRRQFWPWFAFVYLAMTVIGMVGMIPVMSGIFLQMQRVAREHPEDVTVVQGPASYAVSVQGHGAEFMPNLTPFLVAMGVSLVLMVGLLAAAVTRRLHDSGKPGWLGLMPLPFFIAPFYIMPKFFSMMGTGQEPPVDLILLLMVNNLSYFVVLGLMVILLVLKSTPGPNRYGPEPLPKLPRQPA